MDNITQLETGGKPRINGLACIGIVHPYCLLVLGTFLVLLPAIPALNQIPGRDSGAYLYVASRMLSSELPYRDVWDHKPPGIYFLDALGLFLTGGSVWGVWLLEAIALGTAALLGYVTVRRLYGSVYAACASVACLATASTLLERGNFTEEFALPLQFGTIAILVSGSPLTSPRRAAVLGVLAASLLILRPNLIGLSIASVACITINAARWRAWRELTLFSLWFLLAFTIVIVVFLIYLINNGIISPFIDEVFNYNMIYASAAMDERVLASANWLSATGVAGLSVLAVIGWGIAIVALVCQNSVEVAQTPPYVAVIALPLELLLLSAPGRIYDHYYLMTLPVSVLLYAFTLTVILGAIRHFYSRSLYWFGLTRIILLTPLITFATLQLILSVADQVINPDAEERNGMKAVKYIQQTTAPHDFVLIWGHNPGINVVAERRSPSRFVYQFPLYTVGYQDEDKIATFLADLVKHPPSLIIDTSSVDELVPPIDQATRQQWRLESTRYKVHPAMNQIFATLTDTYDMVGRLDGGDWIIYRRKNERE